MPKVAAKHLTDKFVASIKPTGAPQEFSDAGCRGLGIRVSSTGHKAWRLSYTHSNSRLRPSIGSYPCMSLAEARVRAGEVFSALSKGIDVLAPIARDARRDFTFRRVAEEFIRLHVEVNSKDPSDARNIIRNELIAAWGERDIRGVGRRDLHAILDKVSERAPVQANRVKARATKLFSWALDRGYVESFPFYKMQMPTKPRSRTRVLSDKEISAIWSRVQIFGYPFEPLFKLLALLGQRRGEVANMRWSELDLVQAIWTTPTKTTDAHVLPLPETAIAILHNVPRVDGCDYVFPSRTNPKSCVSGFSKWVRKLSQSAEVHDWKLHDLRRTQATGMAKLGVARDIVDRIQCHTIGGEQVRQVSRIYDRYGYLPEMREALERWAESLNALTQS